MSTEPENKTFGEIRKGRAERSQFLLTGTLDHVAKIESGELASVTGKRYSDLIEGGLPTEALRSPGEAQNIASWNPLTSWLRQIDAVMRAA